MSCLKTLVLHLLVGAVAQLQHVCRTGLHVYTCRVVLTVPSKNSPKGSSAGTALLPDKARSGCGCLLSLQSLRIPWPSWALVCQPAALFDGHEWRNWQLLLVVGHVPVMLMVCPRHVATYPQSQCIRVFSAYQLLLSSLNRWGVYACSRRRWLRGYPGRTPACIQGWVLQGGRLGLPGKQARCNQLVSWLRL